MHYCVTYMFQEHRITGTLHNVYGIGELSDQ